MKKLIVCVLLTVFFITLLAVSPAFSAGQEAKIVLRVGHIRDTSHPTHLAALKFKELVEKNSEGRIEVKIYPNSQLGSPQEMFVQMQTGDLEMVYGGINTFAWIKGGEALEITAIPFLYRDYEHMRNSLLSDFFQPIIEKAEKETKIKIININGDTAPRGLTTKDRPVRNADDFKGLKIRTAASPTVLAAMKTLGALPQQIPFAELYMALKTGVVDAQENGALVVISNSLYEVQNYYVKTDYIRDIETFYMGMDTWNKLSKEDQELIYQATEEAGDYETMLTQVQLNSAYKTLKEKMTVIIPDGESIREKLLGIFDEWEGVKWPEGLLEKIRNVK
jgi:tripartite ATP-independent transporter DctP family solute receptor